MQSWESSSDGAGQTIRLNVAAAIGAFRLNRTSFRFPNPTTSLPHDGERFVSGMGGEIENEHYHRYLFALAYCAGKNVLDVASGEGYGSACLGQVARSVVGVDNNAVAVDFANANYLNDHVSFKRGQAQQLPIESQSIDVVVSFETLEHLTEHELFGDEIRRVLRPSGLLIMSSPNRTIYNEEAGHKNEFHVRELDRNEFVEFLKAHFLNFVLFSQRSLVGSVIANEKDQSDGVPEGFISKSGGVFERTQGTPNPPFFIALASDIALPVTRPSMLHNPTFLYRIEEKRQQAVSQLDQRTAQVSELEKVLFARGQQVSDLESIYAASDEQVRELAIELKARIVDSDALVESLESVKAKLENVKSQLVVEQRRCGVRERNEALRGTAQARIANVNIELEQSRHRNEELLAEIDGTVLRLSNLDRRYQEVSKEKDSLLAVLDGVTHSISWKSTAPLRRVAAQLRELKRRFAPSIPDQPSAATSTSLLEASHIESSMDFLRVPLKPSEYFRSKNSAWLEPQKRPDFIHLRSIAPRGRIAVVLHLYYPDLWPELSAALLNIPEPFDLFVTLVEGVSDDLAPAIRDAFEEAHVITVDNHGRDILPFLELVRCGVLFKYELICKLHSKRTVWRAGGDEWRQYLVRGILGSRETANQILQAFDTDPDIGIVVADQQVFNGREFWASNEQRLRQLFRRVGLKASSFEKDFVGGSIYWIRPFLMRSIEALGLTFDDFELEPIASDGTTAHAVERLISLICHDAGMRIEQTGNLPLENPEPRKKRAQVHLIANYLPQFHPVPENSVWWGKGFTEWTNVTAAAPLFEGHRQPRVPADLGFYDLRLPEVRQAQADLAQYYGVTAFSYYYYWFNGRRMLERPLDEVLTSGVPDFPFMICWANEPWTRNWDGLAKEILLPQDYTPGWERSFAADVAPLMNDRRYLRLNNRPVLAIYRVMHIPDAGESMRRLRAALAEEGVSDVHLIGGWLAIQGDQTLPPLPEDLGLDAYFEFPPHQVQAPEMTMEPASQIPGFNAHVYDYGATVDAAIDRLAAGSEGFRYRGVMTSWDNTARRGRNASAFHGATPANFRRWLVAAVEQARAEAWEPETAVFINAWNEWAEGAYLEPDRDLGYGWLEAVASVVRRAHADELASQGVPPIGTGQV